MKFTASHPLSPTLSFIVNKGITVFFGGTEELLKVQGEAPNIQSDGLRINFRKKFEHMVELDRVNG